jgi:hypothetical protein
MTARPRFLDLTSDRWFKSDEPDLTVGQPLTEAGESSKWAVAIHILKLRVLRRFPPARGNARRQQLSVFDVQCGDLRGPVGRIDGDLLDGPERLIVLRVERRAADVIALVRAKGVLNDALRR